MSIHATSTEVYSGKNLYNPTISQTTAYGVTGVGTVNGFTLNGTANANGYRLGFNSATLPAGTYTVTVYYDSGTHSGGNIPFILYKTGTWTSVTTFYAMNFSPDSTPGSRTTTFTLSEETEITLYVYFGTDPTLPTFTDFKCRVQVETGSTATSYEPYVGGVPSPLISDVAHVSTSKNLLNMQSDSNGEYFGTTSQQRYSGKNLINASSSFTVTNSDVYRSIPVSISNGTTVCVQCDSITTNSTTGCSIRFQDSNFAGVGTVILYPGVTLSQSVTLIGDAAYCYVYSSNNYASSQSATTTYTNLMVSKGSAAQPYEPYVGGVPSPNPDYPQEIATGKLASKNIFEAPSSPAEVWQGDYTKITANSLKVKSTVNHPSSTAYARVDITGLTPNTDYYFSYNYERTGGSVSGPTVGGIATRIDGGAISSVTVGGRKINTGPGTYIRFYFYVGQNTSITTSDEVTFSNIQLEHGSTATAFEPYFTPIELAQIGTYQDKVYKSNSGWTLHREMGKTDLATETWTKGGVGGGGAIYMVSSSMSNIKYVPNNQTLGSGFAEKYIMRIGSGLSGNSAINQMAIDVTRVGVNVGFTEVTPSGLFYYALNTPTDTAITDSATIAWLNKYDTDALPHHKYVNTRRTTYVGASGLASAIDLYDGSYASTLPTYTSANDHHLTTANGGTYTVSLQNISAKIVSGTVTFSVFTNQRKIDFSWNGSATSTNVSVSLQADEYIKSIYAYIPQDADAGITLSQQLESGSLTDFEPYYNIVKIYAGDDLVFEDTSLTD